jgi:signal recognition particle subunit SEC65
MKADGYTAKELAELLDITYDNIRKRIEKAGIKPITREAIYPKSTLEAIRDVRGKGRPPKKPAADTADPVNT